MAKYDGLIIPRSYNDYINKSDPIGVSQALQLTGVMDNAPAAQSTKPAKSGGIFAASAVIMASGATFSGVAISAGSVVRVLFTADLTGSNTTTGLTLTYNGNAYAVKVGKNGALAAFVASEISSGVFKYLQAYTTLELMYDGTQLIIIGNPVVLSSENNTIYADGLQRVNSVADGNKNIVTSNAVFQSVNSLTYIKELTNTNYTSFLQIPRGVYSIGTSIYSSYTDKPSNNIEGRIIFIAGAMFASSDEQVALLITSKDGHLYLGYCYGGTPRYDWKQIV